MIAEECEGEIRLWQSVVYQALLDGSMANPDDSHQFEARLYIESDTFDAVCDHVFADDSPLNARVLRERYDDPAIFERIQAELGGIMRRAYAAA